MSRFSDIPFFILRNFIDEYKISNVTSTDPTVSLSPIVLDYDNNFELSLKVKTSADSEFYNYKYVIFNAVSYTDDKITVKYNSSKSLSGSMDTVENGDEVYIRKNSKLYEIVKSSSDYNASVFFNKDYFYIGKIQETKENYIYDIYIENLHKHLVKSLPEHNRTEKLKEFLKLAFDDVYQEIYNKQKHILSLIDPIETNKDWLKYIANIYNVEIDDLFIRENDYPARSFVKNLPMFLKRKGTYSSIFISSQFNIKNNINVYERWYPKFDWGVEGTTPPISPEPYFIDFDYINYYSKELTGGCNSIPTENLNIPPGGVTTLYNDEALTFIQIKKSREWTFVHNFNTNNFIWQCYNEKYEKVYPLKTEFVNSRSVKFTFSVKTSGYIFARTPLSDSVETLPTPADIASWEYTHGLYTKYPAETDFNKNLYPITSYNITASLSATTTDVSKETPSSKNSLSLYYGDLEDNVVGLAVQSDYVHTQTEPTSAWNVTHNLTNNILGVVSQFYVSVPKKSMSIWHNLSSKNIIVQAFDNDKILVNPLSIKIESEDYITITFTDDFSGVIIISLGSKIPTTGAVSLTTVVHNLHNRYNFTQIYDIQDNLLSNVVYDVPLSTNITQVSLGASTELYTNVVAPDYIENVNFLQKTWSINHDLDSTNSLVQVYTQTDIWDKTVWDVYHDLNTVNVIVQAFDMNHNLLFPDSIEIISTNAVKITHSDDQMGYVSIINASYTSLTDAVIEEFENTYHYPLISIVDNAYKWFTPYDVYVNHDTITLFISSVDKTVNMVAADWHNTQNVYSTEWVGNTFYDNVGIHQFYSDTLIEASGIWPTIDHNVENGIVMLWDNDNDEIPFSDFSLIITGNEINVSDLDDGIDGRVVITSGTKTTQDGASNTWTVTHNLGSTNVIPQAYDSSGNLLLINNVTVVGVDGDVITLSFTGSVSGYCNTVKGDYVFTQSEATSAWIINHDLDTENIIFETWDLSGNSIKGNTEILDKDNIISIFDAEEVGYMVIKKGYPLMRQVQPTALEILSNGKFKATFEDSIRGYSMFKESLHLQHFAKHEPEYIKHIDDNNTEISFGEVLKTGVAVFKIPDFTGMYVEKEDQPLTQTLSRGGLSATFDTKKIGYCVVSGVSSLGYHSGLYMSPHYKVELDLSCQPYNATYVLPESVINMLVQTWEYVRPVCKYAHYDLYVQPLSDFTEDKISLYEVNNENAQFYSSSKLPIFVNPTESDIYLHRQLEESEVWNISHEFDKNALIQCFNNDNELIYPDIIEVVDSNSVDVYFIEGKKGYSLLTDQTEGFTETYITSGYNWTEEHASTFSSPFVQVYDYKNNYIFPLGVTHVEESNKVILDFGEKIKGLGTLTQFELKIDLVQSPLISELSTSWTIKHGLGMMGVIAQVYDSNGNEIIPHKYKLEDNNTCVIEFENIIIGAYVILKSVGNIYTMDSIIEFMEDGGYIKFGNGTTGESFVGDDLESPIIHNSIPLKTEKLTISPDDYEDVQSDEYWYIRGTCKNEYEGYISEMGIFDSDDNLLFYSFFGKLFKPKKMNFTVEYKIENKIIEVETPFVPPADLIGLLTQNFEEVLTQSGLYIYKE